MCGEQAKQDDGQFLVSVIVPRAGCFLSAKALYPTESCRVYRGAANLWLMFLPFRQCTVITLASPIRLYNEVHCQILGASIAKGLGRWAKRVKPVRQSVQQQDQPQARSLVAGLYQGTGEIRTTHFKSHIACSRSWLCSTWVGRAIAPLCSTHHHAVTDHLTAVPYKLIVDRPQGMPAAVLDHRTVQPYRTTVPYHRTVVQRSTYHVPYQEYRGKGCPPTAPLHPTRSYRSIDRSRQEHSNILQRMTTVPPYHRTIPPYHTTVPYHHTTVPYHRTVPPYRTVPYHRTVPPHHRTVPRTAPPYHTTAPTLESAVSQHFWKNIR